MAPAMSFVAARAQIAACGNWSIAPRSEFVDSLRSGRCLPSLQGIFGANHTGGGNAGNCGDRGWIGDNPFIYLDCSRIRALGWTPRLSIRAAVLRTLDYLQTNPTMLETRA